MSSTENSDISGSDSDDIEILSVHVSPKASRRTLSGEQAFMWSEISEDDIMTPGSLRRALDKYEVLATDEQVEDMVHLLSRKKEASLQEFISIVETITKKT